MHCFQDVLKTRAALFHIFSEVEFMGFRTIFFNSLQTFACMIHQTHVLIFC
jgi:hypothetical protein